MSTQRTPILLPSLILMQLIMLLAGFTPAGAIVSESQDAEADRICLTRPSACGLGN